jgi:hypothetical protein
MTVGPDNEESIGGLQVLGREGLGSKFGTAIGAL